MKNRGSRALSRRVVPTRHYAGKEWKLQSTAPKSIYSDLAVVENSTAKLRAFLLHNSRYLRRYTVIWRKSDYRVEAKRLGVLHANASHSTKKHFTNSEPTAFLAPDIHHDSRVWNQIGSIDYHQGSPAYPDVPWIPEVANEISNDCYMIVAGMLLRDQDLIVFSVPPPRPVLVCPAQAKRQIGRPACKHLLDRLFQQSLASEPVVVVAESVNSISLCQRGLGLSH
jgi:hypothetical protein